MCQTAKTNTSKDFIEVNLLKNSVFWKTTLQPLQKLYKRRLLYGMPTYRKQKGLLIQQARSS